MAEIGVDMRSFLATRPYWSATAHLDVCNRLGCPQRQITVELKRDEVNLISVAGGRYAP